MRHFHSATKALFIAAIFVIATFAANNASAQTAATATNVPASATIASAMGITRTVDLSFGSVSPAAGTTSTLILDESDGRTVAGGATLVLGGTVTSASFDVTGDTSATYAFTDPGNITLTSGGDTMTVNTWTALSATSGTATLTLDGTGADTMTIGATLNMAAAQAAGDYTGTFNLTIDYN